MHSRLSLSHRAVLLLLCLSAPPLAASSLSCKAEASSASTPTNAEAEAPQSPDKDNLIVRNARVLWEQNKLPSPQQLREWLQSPTAAAIPLAPPSATLLAPREIARRAAAAYLRLGWVFQCNKCSNWHTSLAGGYAISRDTVATAHHVLATPERMKADTGYPIAVRGDGEVLVISGILGADSAADSAVLRLKNTDLQPLPLTPEVAVGDAVFCLSDPTGETSYFSAGIVNRHTKAPGAKTSGRQSQRLNVSTDWAPGSSGSAVLDACGNVVGHVGSITAISSPSKGTEPISHYMTLHWAIPAAHVLHLVNPAGAVFKK